MTASLSHESYDSLSASLTGRCAIVGFTKLQVASRTHQKNPFQSNYGVWCPSYFFFILCGIYSIFFSLSVESVECLDQRSGNLVWRKQEKNRRTWEEAKVRGEKRKFGKVQAGVKNQQVAEDSKSQR